MNRDDCKELIDKVTKLLDNERIEAQGNLDRTIDNGYDVNVAVTRYANARKLFGQWDDIDKDELEEFLVKEED